LSTLPSQTEAAASQKLRDDPEFAHTLQDRSAAHQELLPDLADQLRAVVQQTENTVLEISEKFMNIAGRARRQLQATTDIIESMAQDQQAASGSAVDRTAKAEKLASKLEGLSAETDMLGNDINGVIMSLQFQDITRQQIEKVIGRIALFQQELNDIKRMIEPGRASASELEGPRVSGPGVNRGEYV
jgi:chemotaxis regulatin CheY-phosphate phosphatase CheZ